MPTGSTGAGQRRAADAHDRGAYDRVALHRYLDTLGHRPLDTGSKGLPGTVPAAAEIGTRRWNVLAGDLPFPAAILKLSALEHNSRWMRSFLAATGVSLAPHGKTTMAPQLFARQLADGCWGITVATAQQAAICAAAGIKRILMANQLVGPANIRLVLDLLAADPELEFFCYVDSPAGAALLAETLRARALRLPRPLNVLLEMGMEGGRTGLRNQAEAAALLDVLAQARDVLRLRGIAGYEGLIGEADQGATERKVAAFLETLTEIFMLARSHGAFETGAPGNEPAEAIISAGGSTFFDIVAARLGALRDPGPTRVVIRSGCYLTHDSGQYQGEFPALARRLPADLAAALGPMAPALFVWSCVQSRPEPGLALLTMGKRDASHDAGLPIPLLRGRIGEAATQPLDISWRIERMNDQHAYLHLPPEADLAVGDLICCGISHPCTTFDKWREIHVVDDTWTVVETIRTFF